VLIKSKIAKSSAIYELKTRETLIHLVTFAGRPLVWMRATLTFPIFFPKLKNENSRLDKAAEKLEMKCGQVGLSKRYFASFHKEDKALRTLF